MIGPILTLTRIIETAPSNLERERLTAELVAEAIEKQIADSRRSCGVAIEVRWQGHNMERWQLFVYENPLGFGSAYAF